MTSIAQPVNLEDVIALIHRLYQPGVPEELSRIQDILQDVQRSPDGWQLADSLLDRQDQHVRFFGALTFTVKLNSDWESLSEEYIPVLGTHLVGWLVRLVNEDAPPLVVKKLCSTLVVFFIRFPESWPNCLKHLIYCLSVGQARSATEVSDAPSPSHLPITMKPGAKLAALWFAAILVEEVGKVDTKNIKNHHFYDKILDNEADAVELVKNAIEMPNGLGSIPEKFDARVVEAGLKTFQAWVSCSLRALIECRAQFLLLKTLTPAVVNWLASEDVFEFACDVVIEILSMSFSFLTPEDSLSLANILTSPWARERYESLRGGDSDWASIQFGRLLVTFAEATVQKLAMSLHTAPGRSVMEMLHGILTAPGYPQVDDEISGTTFEFWESLVEFLLENYEVDDTNEPWVEDCQKEVKRAIEEFWRKIRIPPSQESLTWTKDQKDGFMSYRKDVADFVESAYGLLAPGLFEQLVDQVIGALTPGQNIVWEEIEASLFCLNALSDSLSDEPQEDIYMERLFGCNLFAMMADVGSDIPLKARTTSVNLVGSYASFFERRPSYLPPALNFLFTCISNPALARNASKSISSLCSSCRSTLTSELYAFLHQYNLFAASPSADDIAKEKVLCAISYVVQALPSEQQMLDPVSKLLGHVEEDAQKCLTLIQHGREEEAKEAGLLALRCLVAVGKGLQAPDDVPVDLSVSSEGKARTSSFWESGEGVTIQRKVVELMRNLCDALRGDGEIVGASCCVFKTGFAEMSPGLFVFPPEVVTEFLLEYRARTETILATAGTLISSHSIGGSADISTQVRQLLDFVVALIADIGYSPQNEPEIAQSVTEFLSRLLRCYVGVLVSYQPSERLEQLFVFALDSLAVRETLVKKAATSFWTGFVSLPAPESAQVQAAVDGIIKGCGPRLVEKLCWSIGGGCQRSEVDTVVEPLKKLATRQPQLKTWLKAALDQANFPTANVSEKDKRLFIEKVISLRGKRGTNQIAKEFWLKARGTEFAYVS